MDVALGTCESSVADPRVLLLIFIIIQSEEETLVISLSAFSCSHGSRDVVCPLLL